MFLLGDGALGVRLANGAGGTLENWSASPVRELMGAEDADGDGADEVFVSDSRAAVVDGEPRAGVVVVRWVDCAPVLVRNEQDGPYVFLVGTRVLADLQPPVYERSGMGCIDADADGQQDLVGLVAQETGSQVDWTRTIVRLEGGRATNGPTSTGFFELPREQPAVDLLSRATCGQDPLDGR